MRNLKRHRFYMDLFDVILQLLPIILEPMILQPIYFRNRRGNQITDLRQY